VLENTMISGHVIITSRQRTGGNFFLKIAVQCNAMQQEVGSKNPGLNFDWVLECLNARVASNS